jgi:hypothetical protein
MFVTRGERFDDGDNKKAVGVLARHAVALANIPPFTPPPLATGLKTLQRIFIADLQHRGS